MIRALCLLGVVTLWTSHAGADPLDRVTGTESWRAEGPQSIESEWQDWYKARVMWRRARQELRLPRRRNHQLAQLLRYSRRGRVNLNRARHIIRSRPSAQRAAPRAAPRKDHSDADAILQQSRTRRRPVKVYNPAPGQPRKGKSDTPEPPSWVKVPLERLDNSGQAIDDEGDRVLDESSNKKQRR